MNQEEAAEHLISTLYPPTLNLYTVHLAKALQTLYPPALNLYTGHLPGESTANLSSNLELVQCTPCEGTANLSSNLANLYTVHLAKALQTLYPPNLNLYTVHLVKALQTFHPTLQTLKMYSQPQLCCIQPFAQEANNFRSIRQ